MYICVSMYKIWDLLDKDDYENGNKNGTGSGCRCLAAHAQSAKRNPKQFGAKMCRRARQKCELKENR